MTDTNNYPHGVRYRYVLHCECQGMFSTFGHDITITVDHLLDQMQAEEEVYLYLQKNDMGMLVPGSEIFKSFEEGWF